MTATPQTNPVWLRAEIEKLIKTCETNIEAEELADATRNNPRDAYILRAASYRQWKQHLERILHGGVIVPAIDATHVHCIPSGRPELADGVDPYIHLVIERPDGRCSSIEIGGNAIVPAMFDSAEDLLRTLRTGERSLPSSLYERCARAFNTTPDDAKKRLLAQQTSDVPGHSAGEPRVAITLQRSDGRCTRLNIDGEAVVSAMIEAAEDLLHTLATGERRLPKNFFGTCAVAFDTTRDDVKKRLLGAIYGSLGKTTS